MSSKKLWFPQSNGFKLPHIPNILNKILNYPKVTLYSLLCPFWLLQSSLLYSGVRHRRTLSFPRVSVPGYSGTVASGYCSGLNTTVNRSKSMTSYRRLIVAFSLCTIEDGNDNGILLLTAGVLVVLCKAFSTAPSW